LIDSCSWELRVLGKKALFCLVLTRDSSLQEGKTVKQNKMLGILAEAIYRIKINLLLKTG